MCCHALFYGAECGENEKRGLHLPYFPPGQRNEPSSLLCSPSEARQHTAFVGVMSHQALARRQALLRPEMTTPPAPSRAAAPPIPPPPPTELRLPVWTASRRPARARTRRRRLQRHGRAATQTTLFSTPSSRYKKKILRFPFVYSGVSRSRSQFLGVCRFLLAGVAVS